MKTRQIVRTTMTGIPWLAFEASLLCRYPMTSGGHEPQVVAAKYCPALGQPSAYPTVDPIPEMGGKLGSASTRSGTTNTSLLDFHILSTSTAL